jgi:WD40 repeat protein
MAPALELIKSHHGEVTCVGFCADGQHFVSGSEDNSVCVWERGRVDSVLKLRHKAPVRSLACSPKGAWLLVGCADGSITLWDLTQPKEPIKTNSDQHRGPVTALAFSPDGDYFASGGEDNSIVMWKANGEKLYAFDAEHGVNDPHQGTITSLNFTPQCTLVSASRDNTLRIWNLGKNGAKQAMAPITNRGGTVGQLGVSPQGLMLFDKGKSIQLLSMADSSTVCVLDNLAGTNPFDTLALFSPDGSLMMTGGAGEGRLHLWKTPTRNTRAYQVRELVTKDRSGITSAAFAPGKNRFAVTGSKDGFVHIWALPDEATVANHQIWLDGNKQALKLDLVELETNAGKTRIAANVENPQSGPEGYRLRPGQRVTVVVMLPGN